MDLWNRIGYDESNNGKYPEICVAVASPYDRDFDRLQTKIPKVRTNDYQNLKRKLGLRDYRYLLFTETDNTFIKKHKHKKLGLILSSLLFKKNFDENLSMFIDGEWNIKSIDYAKAMISEITDLPRGAVEIFPEAHLDQQLMIVNIADETASMLRKKSIDELCNDEHRKQLLIDMI